MNRLRLAALGLALGLAACSKPEQPTAAPDPEAPKPAAPAPAQLEASKAALADPLLREGQNFRVASPDAESASPKVIEFFSYGCPACFGMEPFMKDYAAKRPKSIAIELVPLPIHDEQGLLLRAFYIGKRLNLLDRSHDALFKRLHADNKPLQSTRDLVDFFVALGADQGKVEALADDQGLLDEAKAGLALAVKFQVMSTPSFVVNDKYYTDGRMAGESLGEVLDRLALRNKPAVLQ